MAMGKKKFRYFERGYEEWDWIVGYWGLSS